MLFGSLPRYSCCAFAEARYSIRALAPSSFFGSLDSMKPSIGASSVSMPTLESTSGNAKKSRSSWAAPSNCWPTNMPSRYMPDFLLERPCAASCQVRPSAPSWWNGSSSFQVLKTVAPFGSCPGPFAGHQVDVKVVAVDAQVGDVERPHRGPAVLVGEADRRQAVLLHLAGERLELVERLGDLVAVLLEHALAVEERPRVVVERHEVLLAVEAGGGLLQRVAVVRADLRPHVGDVGAEPLLREALHGVAGEPGERVVGLALQVAVDLLLERVVVDCVDLHVPAGGRLEVGEHLLV